jgi:hypothetical protein
MRWAAPASSITSMALSGRWRSLMYLALSSAAACRAAAAYLTLWCSSKRALEALEDVHRLLHRGLDHVHLLEAARQRRVFLEDATVLGEGGGADALELAAGQRRLEQVGRVQRAARGRTGTDQGVDLVDEQDGVGLVLERLEHALEALLEVAAVLGAGQQRAHVERIHVGLGQDLGHVLLGDAPGQALGNGGLAHAGLAHQQRVVLAAAAQDLDHALDLVLAADQRVDLAVLGGLVEVLGELLQRRGLFVLSRRPPRLGLAFAGLVGSGGSLLLDAVGDEVDHVQAGHALLVQVVHGVRVLLAEDGHQHVGAGDFLLAVAGGLHVHDGALDHALETQRGLGVHLVGAGHLRRVVLDEVGQRLAQVVDVGRAGAQHLGRAGVVQQGQQQVLHRDEFVALLPGLDEGHVQADFKFLGNHAFPLPCWCALLELLRGPTLTAWGLQMGNSAYSTGSLRHCRGCPATGPPPAPGRPWWLATSREYTPQMPLPSRWIFSMIWVAVSRSLLKNSWMTCTTNSMG